MLSSFKESTQIAKETNEKLTAYDFKSSDLVLIIHEEGTTLTFRSAFIKEWKDYILIFTEHHGTHVYHRGDLSFWGHFSQKDDEKLKDTGYSDKCEFCGKEMKVEDLIYDHHPVLEKCSYQYHVYCHCCKDIENCNRKDLWKSLNYSSWNFVWGYYDLEHIKKALAMIMREDYIDNWLDTPNTGFPNTPRKVWDHCDYEEIYMMVYETILRRNFI